MIRNNLINIVVGVCILAISACDRSESDGDKTARTGASSDASSGQVACLDPATGKLIEPGPGVECRVPEEDKVQEEPVIKDLEGGGKLIDPKGRFDKNQAGQTPANRMAVLDRKTGKLITQRPEDPKAAARYDRSIARATLIMKRQSKHRQPAVWFVEDLPDGGIIIDPQGRFEVPLVVKLSKDGQVRIQHHH